MGRHIDITKNIDKCQEITIRIDRTTTIMVFNYRKYDFFVFVFKFRFMYHLIK